ncbi:hypothetical protein [Pacificispira sp.]|uniref:hypothetical protein n=1 Tax=Pacificispira sp. TaxID=2888761 RepID=UPI003B525EAC
MKQGALKRAFEIFERFVLRPLFVTFLALVAAAMSKLVVDDPKQGDDLFLACLLGAVLCRFIDVVALGTRWFPSPREPTELELKMIREAGIDPLFLDRLSKWSWTRVFFLLDYRSKGGVKIAYNGVRWPSLKVFIVWVATILVFYCFYLQAFDLRSSSHGLNTLAFCTAILLPTLPRMLDSPVSVMLAGVQRSFLLKLFYVSHGLENAFLRAVLLLTFFQFVLSSPRENSVPASLLEEGFHFFLGLVAVFGIGFFLSDLIFRIRIVWSGARR